MNTLITAVATTAAVLANMFAPVMPAALDLPVAAIVDVEQNPYAKLYYYEADKKARYEAYQALHAELPADEVVWRVNAGLDYDFYTNIQPVADVNTVPFIVNKYYQLSADYVPADLTALPSGRLATKDTCAAYNAMVADARKEGLRIYDTSAYRSYATQKRLYDGYLKRDKGNVVLVDTYSARPGHSEHQTGRAIDLCGSYGSLDAFINTPEGPWVRDNCYKYGFIVRYEKDIVPLTGYKYEPWHITYVGVDIAADMRQKGITCLEEYVVKYIDHKPSETV